MRKPHEYIASAVARLASSLPEVELVCGAERGKAVQTSAREAVDAVTEDSPNEAVRFIAPASSFPSLTKGRLVETGGKFRLVTSMRTDLVGASLSFGASAEMTDYPASYTGSRREGGSVRHINIPIDILAIENAALPAMYAEAAAPGYEQSWNICIAEESWLDVTAPQLSDAIEFYDPKSAERLLLRVSSVVRHDGWWMLKARPRGGV